MAQRKYEIHGEDQNGDLWIVASDLLETAEAIAKQFREDGYINVRIVEN
jgi:hypothetical protein